MAGDRNSQIAILLAKLEATENTDPTPAATNAIQILAPFDPNIDHAFKRDRPKLVVGAAIGASRPLTPKGRFGTWQSDLMLRGTKDGLLYSSSNLPEIDCFMQSAGLSSTVTNTGGSEKVTYAPAATSLKSHAEYYYQDGKLFKMLAAKTDIDFSWEAGGPVMATLKRTGLIQATTDAALVSSPVYGTALPPTTDSMALTIDSYAAGIIRKWTFSLGNQIAQRPNANASGGLAPHKVRSRAPKWTVTLEEELIATKDFENLKHLGTSIALSWFLNAAQYNRSRWTAPAAVIEDVKTADDNGTRVTTLSGGVYDSTYGGNDSFALALE